MLKIKTLCCKKRYHFCLICLLIPCLSWAHSWDFFITGGPNATKLSNRSNLIINPLVVNAYNSQPQTEWNAFGGGGLGLSFEHRPYSWSVSVAGYALELGDSQGTEQPLINAGLFDSLSYQYHASNGTLLAESRGVYTNYTWQPFVLAGLGQAWNRLSHYQEYPTDPTLSAVAASPGFRPRTTQALAYELGLGVQHLLWENPNLKRHYSASLGYRYFNLGEARLGPMPFQTSGLGLRTKALTTNAIALSLAASFY